MPLGSAPQSTIEIDFTRAQGINSSGRISFRPPRQKVGTTMLSSSAVVVKIENGVGSVDLVRLPAGVYDVTEEIDGRPARDFKFALPLDAASVINYEDIAPVTTPPTTYTVVRSVNGVFPNPTTGNVTIDTGGGGVTDHGALSGLGDDDHPQYTTQTENDTRYYTKVQVDAIVDGISTAQKYPVPGKVFCPEDYGTPVGDGVADDHAAVDAAWTAMWTWLQAAPTPEEPYRDEAVFYIPWGKHYRVDSSIGSRLRTDFQARAFLVIPMISRSTSNKKIVRIEGAGEHYTLRPAELGGTPRQINPPCSLIFDSGSTTHTWSNTLGLPCAIGATDADMTDFEGNTFSNVQITVKNLTFIQNDNPSLCMLNLEQCSTARLEDVRFAVKTVLDAAPECTNKTGASFLLPRSNNNVAIAVDRVIVENHFTGPALTEHGSIGDVITVANVIGLSNRRPNSHHSYVKMVKIEQCAYGIAGYDPAGAGVRTAYGWSGDIAFIDFEDYAYNGAKPERYTPLWPHQHVWDENNVLNAYMRSSRINSESGTAPGVGVAPFGDTNSLYVRGATNFEMWNRKGSTAVQRLNNEPGAPVEGDSLFEATSGPSSDNANANPICLGVEAHLTAAGSAIGLRYWRATSAMSANPTGRLYKVSDQSVVPGSDVTFDAGTRVGEWIEALFSAPIPLTAITEDYIAMVRMPNGQYAATTSYFDSGPGATGITSGILRAENFNDFTPPTPGQGCFKEGAMGFPTNNGNGTNYWVDLIVTPG